MHSETNPSPEMLTSGCDRPKSVGDIVKVGPNAGPNYRILAIDGHDAWIRSVEPKQYGGQHIVALHRLRTVHPNEEAIAA